MTDVDTQVVECAVDRRLGYQGDRRERKDNLRDLKEDHAYQSEWIQRITGPSSHDEDDPLLAMCCKQDKQKHKTARGVKREHCRPTTGLKSTNGTTCERISIPSSGVEGGGLDSSSLIKKNEKNWAPHRTKPRLLVID